MAITKFLIIFLFLTIQNSLATEQGVLILDGRKNTFKAGDIVSGKIEFFPVEERERVSFYFLEGRKIDNKILIIKLNKVEPNPNNSDVLDVYALFGIIGSFDQNSILNIKIQEKNIPVKINSARSESTKLEKKRTKYC